MPKTKTLIIKLGAMGDVLRTTPILRVLKEHEISWLTKKESLPLVEGNPFINHLYTSPKQLQNQEFELVINLDDDKEGCQMLNEIKYQKLLGFYMLNNKVTCTPTAIEWFAMSLNGGPDRDILKKANKKSRQEHLFQVLGERFNGEEYVLPIDPKTPEEIVIGLEKRSGERWPMKRWKKYGQLAKLLKSKGYKVKLFKYHFNLKDFINDINECSIIVTGDTLTMHLGLAFKKQVITLFGPTSAVEIYDYDRLKKIVPKIDCICCYKKTICWKRPNCMDLITVEEVYDAIEDCIKGGLNYK